MISILKRSKYLQGIGNHFHYKLLVLALPIALQVLMFSCKGMLDTVMLTTQGELMVAAAGGASKLLFVVVIFLLGLSSGGAQLAAQAWGHFSAHKGGVNPLPGIAACSMQLLLLFSLPCTLLFLIWPEMCMGWLSDDQEVVKSGADFLRLMSLTLPLFAYTASMYSCLRAMQLVGVVTRFSIIGVCANIVFNAFFIFGWAGLPRMGCEGVALGTLLSALLELTLLLAYLYRFQPELLFFPIWRLATQAKLQCILSLQLAANSTLWALGSLFFFGILAREGVSSLAALALLAPLESISLSFLIGLSSAASILIGTSLGRGEKLRAEQEAWQAFYFSVFMGLITALLLYLAKQQILQIFGQIDPEIMDDVWMLFDWMALCFILRGGAMMLLAGILRAGGDNSFCLALDFSVQWLMLIPCAWILREWLHWPVTWLYGLIVIEEGAKIILALLRLKSGRWLHTLLVEG